MLTTFILDFMKASPNCNWLTNQDQIRAGPSMRPTELVASGNVEHLPLLLSAHHCSISLLAHFPFIHTPPSAFVPSSLSLFPPHFFLLDCFQTGPQILAWLKSKKNHHHSDLSEYKLFGLGCSNYACVGCVFFLKVFSRRALKEK